MLNYETVKKNYETIRKFATRYRNELTVYQGVMAEFKGMMACQDYIKIMNEMSEDVFCGNMLVGMFNLVSVNLFEQILNGDKKFEIESYMTNEMKELYNEKISAR